MKVGGIKTLKELTTGVQQFVRLLFNNNLSTPDLSFILDFEAILFSVRELTPD